MIFHDAQPPWHAGGTQQPPTGETSYPHRAILCVALPKRRPHGASGGEAIHAPNTASHSRQPDTRREADE